MLDFTSAPDYITYFLYREKIANRIMSVFWVLSFYCRKFYELGVTLSHCSVTSGTPAWCYMDIYCLIDLLSNLHY